MRISVRDGMPVITKRPEKRGLSKQVVGGDCWPKIISYRERQVVKGDKWPLLRSGFRKQMRISGEDIVANRWP